MTDALFVVDEAERIVRGRLLPFGELSRQSVTSDPIEFSADAIEIPTDPDVVTINRDHNRFEPIGRALSVTKGDGGVLADFRIARTPEGDAALMDIREGRVKALSAEVTGLVRDGAKAVRSRLTGAALVPVGAFEGAALFAALDAPTTDPGSAEADASGEGDPAAEPDLTPEAAPAAPDDPEGTEPEDTEKETTVADAVVPATLTAPGNTEKDTTTAQGLFAAVAAVKNGNPDAVAAFRGGDALFAISNIQHSGPSAVTIGADVQVPNYVGELWKRRPYKRRFVPLINHGTLTSYKVMGWRWTTEPVVGDYTGNAAEIPSNAVDTEPVTADAARIAGGHKIDRRYLDFNDQGVIASYFDHMVEDTARKTDAKALAAIIAAATSTTPGSVPSGVAKGLAAIVDGALDVIGTENSPAFALVDGALWRDIVLTGKDDVLGFLTMSLGLESGDLEGFKILPATIGTAAEAGKVVIVGAKEALTFYELGGEAPIRVEGIDPHHGAFDPAVFAYWATITNNAAAVRKVLTV